MTRTSAARQARKVICPHCQAGTGQACCAAGMHAARYDRAYRRGLISDAAMTRIGRCPTTAPLADIAAWAGRLIPDPVPEPPSELTVRREATAATVREFHRECQAHASQDGPEPDWPRWARRLAGAAGRDLAAEAAAARRRNRTGRARQRRAAELRQLQERQHREAAS